MQLCLAPGMSVNRFWERPGRRRAREAETVDLCYFGAEKLINMQLTLKIVGQGHLHHHPTRVGEVAGYLKWWYPSSRFFLGVWHCYCAQ